MYFTQLTHDQVSQSLREFGFDVANGDIRIERRDERWQAFLPQERLAWFAASAEGRTRLATERRLLRLVAERCSFAVPRILAVDESAGFDIRAMVAGTADPFSVFNAVKQQSVADRVGKAIGSLLADQHQNIRHQDVHGWLRNGLTWPESAGWVAQRLPRVVDDQSLIEAAAAAMAAYEAVRVSADDRAVVHGDFGYHNLGIDAATWTVNGVFDFEGAAWADRHHDFQYLPDGRNNFLLDAALPEYATRTGIQLDRARILLYNAACAVTYLAFRDGHAPEEEWCGRTLSEDLDWTRAAIAGWRAS